MKIIEAKDYQDMSQTAARFIIEQVNRLSAPVLGLATGGTPLGTYQVLREDHARNKTTYKHVYTVNLDEYVGVSPDHENSYTFYMKNSFSITLTSRSATPIFRTGWLVTWMPNAAAMKR